MVLCVTLLSRDASLYITKEFCCVVLGFSILLPFKVILYFFVSGISYWMAEQFHFELRMKYK